MYIIIYKHTSNPWESNHRDGPTGHKKLKESTNVSREYTHSNQIQKLVLYYNYCQGFHKRSKSVHAEAFYGPYYIVCVTMRCIHS